MSYRKNKEWYTITFTTFDICNVERFIREGLRNENDDIVDVKITEFEDSYSICAFVAVI